RRVNSWPCTWSAMENRLLLHNHLGRPGLYLADHPRLCTTLGLEASQHLVCHFGTATYQKPARGLRIGQQMTLCQGRMLGQVNMLAIGLPITVRGACYHPLLGKLLAFWQPCQSVVVQDDLLGRPPSHFPTMTQQTNAGNICHGMDPRQCGQMGPCTI